MDYYNYFESRRLGVRQTLGGSGTEDCRRRSTVVATRTLCPWDTGLAQGAALTRPTPFLLSIYIACRVCLCSYGLCRYTCLCMYICMEANSQCLVSPLSTFYVVFFETGSLSLSLGSLIWLAWQASALHWSTGPAPASLGL